MVTMTATPIKWSYCAGQRACAALPGSRSQRRARPLDLKLAIKPHNQFFGETLAILRWHLDDGLR